jgi:hypothetical protein
MVSRSVWQMTPRSPFIRRLKIGAFPRSVRVTSIYSKDDSVAPAPCCHLDGDVVNIEIPEVTHREFLFKRAVYELIRRELALGYGEPAPPPKLQLISQLAPVP